MTRRLQTACWLPDGGTPSEPMYGSDALARHLVGSGPGGIGCDAIRFAAGETAPRHDHDWAHILLCTDGVGTLEYDEIDDGGEVVLKRQELHRGVAYLVEPGVPHALLADRGSSLELVVFSSAWQPPGSPRRMTPLAAHNTFVAAVRDGEGGYFAICEKCGPSISPTRATAREAEADAIAHGPLLEPQRARERVQRILGVGTIP